MTRKNHIIIHRLLKKGFDVKMSKHIKLVYKYNGKDIGIRTWVSHGKKEISDQLLNRMAEQLCVSLPQFLDLVDCTLDEAGLIAIYKDTGRI